MENHGLKVMCLCVKWTRVGFDGQLYQFGATSNQLERKHQSGVDHIRSLGMSGDRGGVKLIDEWGLWGGIIPKAGGF